MPRGPKGEKRPADVIGNAVHVMRIATGEIEETTEADDGKDPARPLWIHRSLPLPPQSIPSSVIL